MAVRLSQLRRNWLAAVLLCAGLILRLIATISYRPALFYIDTVRYLYNSGGNDPVGYRLPLKLILAVSDFNLVAVVQHLLGLGMAVTIYWVLLRRGAPRWLAALAMAPVLLDAYQLQMEQMILPDVWFEALIVAGIAVLLARPQAPASCKAAAVAGLIFGISATFRQVGEILVAQAVAYLIVAGPSWRTGLTRAAILAVAFVIPVLGYLIGSEVLVGHFYLSHSGVTTTYGRMAWSADCATLRLPPVERGLCPTLAQRAHGADWLLHSPAAPIRRYYNGPLSPRASALVASFNHAVLAQQPERVLGTYLTDVGKLFAPSKLTSPGDPPLSRWQFQTSYPYLSPHATPTQVLTAVDHYGGGRPAVWRPGATLLRDYQLGGGYTPGPLLAFCVLVGLAGTALTLIRRLRPGRAAATGQLVLAGALFFWCGVAVLLLSDVFEFTWRYQLPALVTLPPAAAAGLAEIARRRATRPPDHTGQLPQASEQVSFRD